jgi:prevent-host-death family protein
MRTFSSADAKNHFGELVDAARLAPVAVTKYDKPFVVVMSAEEYERVKALAELAPKSATRKIKGAN